MSVCDGEFFGELAAIDQQSRSAGIFAVTDTLAARMPADVFRRIVHEHPDVCDQLLQALVIRVRTLTNRVNEHSNLGVRQRLYAELLRLARPPLGSGGYPAVSPPPTHAELASRVSSHREAVTRELNALERGKLIKRRRGAIPPRASIRCNQGPEATTKFPPFCILTALIAPMSAFYAAS